MGRFCRTQVRGDAGEGGASRREAAVAEVTRLARAAGAEAVAAALGEVDALASLVGASAASPPPPGPHRSCWP
jgi:hypothetical protein